MGRTVKRKIAAFAKAHGHAPLALITGGSSGMGLEFARQLASSGCPLILVSNQQEQLDSAKEELTSKYGVTVYTRFQDLCSETAAEDLVAWCEEQGHDVDILIANAGMFFFHSLDEKTHSKAKKMVSLHVVTNTNLCILFANKFKAKGYGNIVIMSSMAAELPSPGITIYAATKAYLKSFAKSLHCELRPYGVTVTGICPAAIATPLYNLDPKLMKFGVAILAIHTPTWLVNRALRGTFRRKRLVKPSMMNIYLPIIFNLIGKRTMSFVYKKVTKKIDK
ncbi:MAG: SDR family NAD(P)-dependent oxidoreductase [Bacteroidales bacterium]|nr:SDR family NAD(P)-dependent oxidoreductase [Bacteroidales bacterium]